MLIHNLRKRMSKIRVFDPACGSGNFLVIAYKEMRVIEAEINRRRGGADRSTEIPLTNFRGIELRDFPAEIARLALIIAEYQCDVLYRGQKEALRDFLPLDALNWITCGNALRLDWLSICPPTGTGVKHHADDLFSAPLDQAEIDFENEGGQTYICGNPPYKGGTEQTPEQKGDMASVFGNLSDAWKSLDYVSGWFLKFASYSSFTSASCAFVSTNSIVQGEQVARLWPLVFSHGLKISFAYTSFKWANLASMNAGVSVAIVGLSRNKGDATIYDLVEGRQVQRRVTNICPYLVPYQDIFIQTSTRPVSKLSEMVNGNKPADGGHLLLSSNDVLGKLSIDDPARPYIRPFLGGDDTIHGKQRFCLWIDDIEAKAAEKIPWISERLELVRTMRLQSPKELTKKGALRPFAFQQVRQTGTESVILVPRHSSESRQYLPVSLQAPGSIVADAAFALFDAPLMDFAILRSRLHLTWIATVCGKLETRYRYSSTLGWNTFPFPVITEKNWNDLMKCAGDILLAREAHFPATIADLYDPDHMPDDLRLAHQRNDEVVERIYIGRRFKNDTERLEKLFELYTKMTGSPELCKKLTSKKKAEARP